MFYQVGVSNFHERVLDTNGMVLVMFCSWWSDGCRKMSSLIKKIDDILDEVDTIVRIDWDQQKQLVQQLGVIGVPTLIIYVKGREVARYFGIMNQYDLTMRIIEAKNNL